MDELRSLIETRLRESNEVRARAMQQCWHSIEQAAQVIAHSYTQGGKLLLCGNGGSAADCQHLATEFVCRLTKERERRALPALALTTDSSFLTAYPNDYNYEGVFMRQVEAFAQAGDVLIGISTSGSSKNIIKAFTKARELGCITIALMGESGPLKELSDISVCIPSKVTQYIQECHLSVEHIICELVEQIMFGKTETTIVASQDTERKEAEVATTNEIRDRA